MNKQEAIKKVEQMGEYERFVNESIPKLSVLNILNQLDEPQKPVVPQFVADWIDYCKENHLTITGAFDPVSEHGIGLAETFKGNAYKCTRWALDNQNLFARAWLDGYEVEKEPKYTVKIKGKIEENLLVYGWGIKRYFFARTCNDSSKRGEHTRKELEEDGFGWVFDCPGIEIEEVE